MSRKALDASRELRLWIMTFLTALGLGLTYLDQHPDFKRKLEEKWERIANRYRKNPEIRVYPPTK